MQDVNEIKLTDAFGFGSTVEIAGLMNNTKFTTSAPIASFKVGAMEDSTITSTDRIESFEIGAKAKLTAYFTASNVEAKTFGSIIVRNVGLGSSDFGFKATDSVDKYTRVANGVTTTLPPMTTPGDYDVVQTAGGGNYRVHIGA